MNGRTAVRTGASEVVVERGARAPNVGVSARKGKAAAATNSVAFLVPPGFGDAAQQSKALIGERLPFRGQLAGWNAATASAADELEANPTFAIPLMETRPGTVRQHVPRVPLLSVLVGESSQRHMPRGDPFGGMRPNVGPRVVMLPDFGATVGKLRTLDDRVEGTRTLRG